MIDKMQTWIQSLDEIEAYLNEHPDHDTYEGDWPPDNFRDILSLLQEQIKVWIVEQYDQKDIVRMIRGSQPVCKNHAYDYLTKEGVGRYVGGHVDEWRWEHEGSECWNKSAHALAIIYRYYCQHS